MSGRGVPKPAVLNADPETSKGRDSSPALMIPVPSRGHWQILMAGEN